MNTRYRKSDSAGRSKIKGRPLQMIRAAALIHEGARPQRAKGHFPPCRKASFTRLQASFSCLQAIRVEEHKMCPRCHIGSTSQHKHKNQSL